MDQSENSPTVKQPAKDSAESTASSQPPESGKQQSDREALSQSLPPGLEYDDAIDAARLEKIEKIKKAIADGTYRVSAEEVARKLIEQMLEPKD